MKLIIFLGKAITLITIGLMLINLVSPFDGRLSLIFNLLLVCTIFMHGIQVAIFHTAFSKQLSLSIKDYLNVFIFGVFSMLQYKNRLTV